MLKISKYRKTIIGCSAIFTASITSFTPSVSANQTNRLTVAANSPAIPQSRGYANGKTLLIAQSATNNSNATGFNVSNPIGGTTGINSTGATNSSNTTGVNVSSPTGGTTGINTGNSNAGGNGTSNANGIGTNNSPRAAGVNNNNNGNGAGTGVASRFNNALSNYEQAAAVLAQEQATQTNTSSAAPVRYSRQAGDLADCGCLNNDTVGTKVGRPELAAAKAAEAEAAAELAKAKSEARQFLESVKESPTASSTTKVSSPLW
jgi:hypothetical protein